jgi:spore coat protein U-like protein
MKKFIISLLIVAAFVAIPVSVFAKFTANDDGTARARVVTTIAISNVDDLDFGSILQSATAGTVVVAPDATGSVTSALSVGVGSTESAEFTVTGSPNATYSITLPSAALTLTPALGATNTTVITVNPFTSSIDLGGVLDDGGEQTIYVGGTLNVPANPTADSYSGAFNVTVAYN